MRSAFFAPLVLNVFVELDIMVSLWSDGEWWDICSRPEAHGLLRFEHKHGAAVDRFGYNSKNLSRACRTRRTVLGRHAGFADLFVPVPADGFNPGRAASGASARGRVDSVLVTGPFRTERPETEDILETWFALTGRQSHMNDPEFAEYLERTLSTLVLEGPQLAKYQRLLECLADLMAGRSEGDSLFAETQALRADLVLARSVERMWRAANRMVNDLDSLAWASPALSAQLGPVGLDRFPSQVVVGLFASQPTERDAIEDRVRRDSFQRTCVAIARKAGNLVSGQVGDHGVTFLGAAAGPASRLQLRRKLLEVAQEASTLGRRRHGFGLHLGLGAPESQLSHQYQEALGAAQQALASGVRMVSARQKPSAPNDLARLRRALIRPIDEKPDALGVRFDRFLDAVTSQIGHRLDVAKLCIEAGFERAVETVLGPGAFETSTFAALENEVERALTRATTTREMMAIYRRSLGDLLEAAAHPVPAQRDRSVRRAEEYMRQHSSEQLTLARVAQVAGFAPTYFSRLFREKHGTTFQDYLMQLRIEHAMHLLSNTSLGVQRVAHLSGFSTRHHFGAMFKRQTRETPGHYRARVRRLFKKSPESGRTREKRQIAVVSRWPSELDQRDERR
jgi:AraC-like DNA-binding protein